MPDALLLHHIGELATLEGGPRRGARGTSTGREQPGADAHRRGDLEDPEHVQEPLRPAEVGDEQQGAAVTFGTPIACRSADDHGVARIHQPVHRGDDIFRVGVEGQVDGVRGLRPEVIAQVDRVAVEYLVDRLGVPISFPVEVRVVGRSTSTAAAPSHSRSGPGPHQPGGSRPGAAAPLR